MSLLARNYLLFTLTLLADRRQRCSALWNAWLDELYRSVDWDALLADPSAGIAGTMPASGRTTWATGATPFAVYDGTTGDLVYASAQDFDHHLYTPASWPASRPTADRVVTIDAYETTDRRRPHPLSADSEHRYEQMAATPKVASSWCWTRHVAGGLRRLWTTARTPTPSGSMPSSSPAAASLTAFLSQRLLYQEKMDRPCTVLLRESAGQRRRTTAGATRTPGRSGCCVLPLYLAAAPELFIWWLGRKIGRPLRRLNDAVVSQAARAR